MAIIKKVILKPSSDYDLPVSECVLDVLKKLYSNEYKELYKLVLTSECKRVCFEGKVIQLK